MNCYCPIYRYEVPQELWRRVVPPHSGNISLREFVNMAESQGIKIYGTFRRPDRPYRSGSGWMLEHPSRSFYELTTRWPADEPCPILSIVLHGAVLVN